MNLFLDSELSAIQKGEEVFLYKKLGAQFREVEGCHGVVFWGGVFLSHENWGGVIKWELKM